MFQQLSMGTVLGICFLFQHMALHTFRCVLSGVQDLHDANYGHTDIRWQNIIQCGTSHRLIDLEFVVQIKPAPLHPSRSAHSANALAFVRSSTAMHNHICYISRYSGPSLIV